MRRARLSSRARYFLVPTQTRDHSVKQGSVSYREEPDVETTRFVAIFVSLITMFAIMAIVLTGKYWRQEQDRWRERRMAEHRMNARLLSLNI
jgi:hypothetical protein